VKTHNWTEGSPLEPADEQFTEVMVIWISTMKPTNAAIEISISSRTLEADILLCCPPGNTGKTHIESSGQLISETSPGGGNVAAPDQ